MVISKFLFRLFLFVRSLVRKIEGVFQMNYVRLQILIKNTILQNVLPSAYSHVTTLANYDVFS